MARKFSSPRNEEEDEQQNEVTPGMFYKDFYDAKRIHTVFPRKLFVSGFDLMYCDL